MPKPRPKQLKVGPLPARPITYAQLGLEGLEYIGNLAHRSPWAVTMLSTLVKQLPRGSAGVVVISLIALTELIGCSIATAKRALRVLINDGAVQRIRISGAYALAINSRIAWIDRRGQLAHAVFSATVVASRTEQDAIALEPPPMQTVPVIEQDEEIIATGDGLPPPSQQTLDGVPAPAIQRSASTDKFDQFAAAIAHLAPTQETLDAIQSSVERILREQSPRITNTNDKPQRHKTSMSFADNITEDDQQP